MCRTGADLQLTRLPQAMVTAADPAGQIAEALDDSEEADAVGHRGRGFDQR
ncbi:hypothetical protein [Streptomyces albogriseolus]|uniref:hypothetical protein n=1 Tax=Streptomyces albogriseolus TaxID=1887 RepID=UPI0036EB1452